MTVDKNYVKGVVYLLVSAFSFALMALFIRLSGDVPFIQKTFFRNSIAFLIALFTLLIHIKQKGLKAYTVPKQSWPFLFLRAAAGTLGVFGNFYAVDHLILADASILNKMAPFYTVLFCWLLLKEKLRLIPALAICFAFGGAILVAKPSFDFSQTLPSFAGIAGGFGAGLAYACVRKMGTQKCPGEIIILFFSAFTTVLVLPYMFLHYTPMDRFQTFCLLMTGVTATIGQFTITAAYFHAPASKISIFDFCQVIFSASLGLIFFGQKPDILSLLGYTVIISMAVMNFIYNNRISQEEKATLTEDSAEEQNRTPQA